jgi:uncharacterized protein
MVSSRAPMDSVGTVIFGRSAVRSQFTRPLHRDIDFLVDLGAAVGHLNEPTPGAEEILFRGWMLSALVYKFNRMISIALTSLVCCALHLEPHQHWLFTMNVVLFSVFACCWALRSGNIWGVMGWHAAWNWLSVVGFEVPFTGYDAHMPALFVKLVDQGPVYLTGGAEGAEGSILCSVILTAGLAFLWLLRRRGNGVGG